MVFAQFSSKVVWFIGILMVFPECGVLFSFYSGSSQVCLGVHHPAPHLSTVKLSARPIFYISALRGGTRDEHYADHTSILVTLCQNF